MRYPTAPTISTAPMANFAPAFMPNYTCPSRACSSAQRTACSGVVTRGMSTTDGKASCRPTIGVPIRCANASSDSLSHPPPIAIPPPAARRRPMERRCDRPPPLGFPRPCRRRPVAREKAFELPAGEEVLERAPHARAQPREGGGAERGGLDHVRPRHGHSQEVRLEL